MFVWRHTSSYVTSTIMPHIVFTCFTTSLFSTRRLHDICRIMLLIIGKHTNTKPQINLKRQYQALLLQYMITAECFVVQAPPQGLYELSLILEKVGRCVTYWKLRLDRCRIGGVPSPRLQRLHNVLQIGVQGHLEV